jgi:hypothetical protein
LESTQDRTVARGRNKLDLPVSEEFLQRLFVFERGGDLRQSAFTDHQFSLGHRPAQQGFRGVGKLRIVSQYVEDD